LLLRAEQLFRIGASYTAVLNEARGLKDLLRGSSWPTLTSLGNAMPMLAAAGVEAPTRRLSPDEFNSLWRAEASGPNSRAKVWASLDAPGGDNRTEGAATWRQRDVVFQLYQKLIKDGRPDTDNLGRAARIVEAVFGASLPPSEAHFLLVLDRDLP